MGSRATRFKPARNFAVGTGRGKKFQRMHSDLKAHFPRLEVGTVQVFTAALEQASIPPADLLQILNHDRNRSDSLRAVFVTGLARNSFHARCLVLYQEGSHAPVTFLRDGK